MRDPFTIPKARCAAFLEVQRQLETSGTVTPAAIVELLVREKNISCDEAVRLSNEVIEVLTVTAEDPTFKGPMHSNALEPFPPMIHRFGEKWSLADETETHALYDCFNHPSGGHRGQVLLIKRWRKKSRRLPSGSIHASGLARLPSAEEFGQYAWNFQGNEAGRRRFEKLKA
jgi:hypothetical protein